MRAAITFCLAILGILALLYAIRTRLGNHTESRPAPLADIYGGIKSALGAYKVDNGNYPIGTNGLLALCEKPDDATNWHGPYQDRIPVDWWGHNYIYECPGKNNTNAYDLFSAGPDGRIGTEDDIGNWTK